MNEKRLRSSLVLALLIAGVAATSACGSGAGSETTLSSSSESTAAVNTTTVATTTMVTVPVISGTFAVNSEPMVWEETPIDPAKTMYVQLEKDFLKVRTGPGTSYIQVASLTDGMAVTVVAKTEDNWYKLSDGYFVFGKYLTDTP